VEDLPMRGNISGVPSLNVALVKNRGILRV